MSGEKRVGLLAGCFDPFPHPGHLLAMEQAVTEAKLDGGIRICLHAQPNVEHPHKAKCIMSMVERRIMLEAIRHVIEVIPYKTESDLLLLLETLEYDVRILGRDYINGHTGHPLPFTGDGVGKELFIASRYAGVSATNYRARLRAGGEI